jgi:hypothetical protein
VKLPDGFRPDRLRRRPADDRQSVTDAIAEVPESNFRVAPRHAATGAREPSALLAAPAAQPLPAPVPRHAVPSFSPHPAKVGAETVAMPLPVEGRPYLKADPFDPATEVKAVLRPAIGDSMAPRAATGPVLALRWLGIGEASALRPTALPYTAPGWATLQMNRWVARGEWEELPAIVEQGYGRNAADEAAGRRHSREAIVRGIQQRCAAIGRPDLAGPLLRQAHELVMAARATAGAGAA